MRKVHLNVRHLHNKPALWIASFTFLLSQHLRKNNFITDENEVVCSVKDYNDYRKLLHRVKTESQAAKKRTDYIQDLDWNRFKLSKLHFDEIHKKHEKFVDKYSEDLGCCVEENPIKHGSVKEIMRRRKLEMECQRVKR